MILILVFSIIAASAAPAQASGASAESNAHAEALGSLNLFRGTEKGFELGTTPTRMQALVMLIRLLGKEDEALAYSAASPFTDIGWGKEYAAYAYDTGLTKGTGETTFSPNSPVTFLQYTTFLLRALGYTEEAADYKNSLQNAVKLGMMEQKTANSVYSLSMNRGDMADLSYAALTMKLKGAEETLAEKLCSEGVFSAEAGATAAVLGDGAGWKYSYSYYDDSTVTYSQHSLNGITADVLTVNLKNPRVSIKTDMVGKKLGATAPFKSIVEASDAYAVVNGNFFEAYEDFKIPIGSVMADGELLYGCSGLSSFGFAGDGTVYVGRPSIFTRLSSSGGSTWAIYEINTPGGMGAETSVMYTPAFGAGITAACDCNIVKVVDGVIKDYFPVSAGTYVEIPANGYLVYMGSVFCSYDYFKTPVIGESVSYEPYLRVADEEGFSLDGVTGIVSGAPRLVKDGKIVTELDPGFTEARFTTAVTPRTAIGVDARGRLLIASIPSASLQQTREFMLALGCVDAVNLDGGASTAMYCGGKYYRTPGRELTVTLQIFVK